MTRRWSRRLLPVAFTLGALGALDCGAAVPGDPGSDTESDPSALSKYSCTGSSCTCKMDPGKFGSGDCDSMFATECCPKPKPKDVFCGDTICDYDSTHSCKCTRAGQTGPVSSSAPSCKGQCARGYSSSAPCQCDSLCPTYGDCCYDYGGQCLAVHKNTRCSCSFDCSLHGNCCLGC